MARHATDVVSVEEPPARLADRMAQRRRAEVALVIEGAALDLFAARPIGDVTLEEIAVAAGVAVRTIYRYFPSKEDMFLAYPRRAAERLAGLVRDRPSPEAPFVAVRNAFFSDIAEPGEVGRWMAAYAYCETHERIARAAIGAIAGSLRGALAERAEASADELWVEMAGWMVAVSLEVGARQLAAKGGTWIDHVLAAWDLVGEGIGRIGPPAGLRPAGAHRSEI